MIFRGSSQTRRILYYLTIICNLASCYVAGKQDDTLSGCSYTYPRDQSAALPYVKIEEISCRNMAIDELPFGENVTRIELVNVPLSLLNLTTTPKALKSPQVDLKKLRWTRSHLKTIQYVPLPNLTELELTSNAIQHLHQDAFDALTQLRKLNLSYNSIETLPEKLFRTNTIRILSFSHNHLQLLPGDVFENLSDLEILDVSNNDLNYLREDTFAANVKLTHLNLSHNKLNVLPQKLFHVLSSLRNLSLEANLLKLLEPATFSTLTSLMILNLGKNPFSSLPDILLPANNTLFILTISHTKLSSLHPSLLHNLRNLRELHLTHNRNLQNLHNDTFANSVPLKIIDLRSNNFTELPYSIVLLTPDELLLDGNPWPCDCTVQWFVSWMRQLGDLRLNAYCNATDNRLIDTVHKMQCKPTIVRVSAFTYQTLDVKVQLHCRAYSNPRPLISWVTPNGLTFVKSESAVDLLRYHRTFDRYPHLESEQNVELYETGDLRINSMTRDDAGEYLCIATNKIGESYALTRLFIDPSIMQRIKTGSLICGLLWINGFLLFSVIYILLRRCTKRAKEDKRRRQMHENMDLYKSQQINKLRERCKNQMNRIKNNCSIQVEWMKENYAEFMKNTQNHRSSYLTTQYNQQMNEIREYYLTQMHKVREHYEQQRNLILQFSVEQADKPNQHIDPLVKMENGLPEEDIYKYNDAMKNEIRKITSLRNLHQVFLDGDKILPKKDERQIKTPPDITENTNAFG